MAKPRTGRPVALGDAIGVVSGVGGKRAAALARLGVEKAGDLLTLWPRRHVDRSVITRIAEVRSGQTYAVVGRIVNAGYEPRGRGQGLLKILINDGSGFLSAVFFHAVWLKSQLVAGKRILLFGRVEWRSRMAHMTHPEHELLEREEMPETGLLPVYPLTADLKQRWMYQLMRSQIPALAEQAADPLPESIRVQERLDPRGWAYLHQHFPKSADDLERARTRLVFDEFLRISLAVLLLSRGNADTPGFVQMPDGTLARDFLTRLPYSLTPGQRMAWDEICHDLSKPQPMARLLQGDVGSGKTTLAMLAMLAALDAGNQAAFMAPTELLAEQHLEVLKRQFEPLGVDVGLLTGQGKDAAAVRVQLADGTLRVVVGTQALLSESVQFERLGLVVVDEQHRFGVRQRAGLPAKGVYPDLLVMTATPIPRTLALTIYGDLAISRIPDLPPGRLPIETVHLPRSRRREAYEAVRRAVREGRQAYVVCPRVNEGEQTDVKAATELAEGMQTLPGWRVGLLHGQMPLAEKSRVMSAFREGTVDVLVATSIVEVGVDVPNATVMVIESAEQFGLAQLHQLRGRIGRGEHASTCFLISDTPTEEAEARIAAMVESTDGLKLAEEDLKIRGPGEVLGMRQHGVAGFQLARPLEDLHLLESARSVARDLLAQDPGLHQHPELKSWVEEALSAALPSQVLH